MDLAGSERLRKTRSEGVVAKEAQYINKSLSFLEQVILALTEKFRDHIPYRSSKLTHMLRDSLGGNCKTTMVANVWAAPEHLDETISTCKFAARIMRIQNAVSVNLREDPEAQLRRYEREIRELRLELAARDGGGGGGGAPGGAPYSPGAQGGATAEPYTETQRLVLRDKVREFLESDGGPTGESLAPLDIVGVRHAKEALLQARLLFRAVGAAPRILPVGGPPAERISTSQAAGGPADAVADEDGVGELEVSCSCSRAFDCASCFLLLHMIFFMPALWRLKLCCASATRNAERRGVRGRSGAGKRQARARGELRRARRPGGGRRGGRPAPRLRGPGRRGRRRRRPGRRRGGLRIHARRRAPRVPAAAGAAGGVRRVHGGAWGGGVRPAHGEPREPEAEEGGGAEPGAEDQRHQARCAPGCCSRLYTLSRPRSLLRPGWDGSMNRRVRAIPAEMDETKAKMDQLRAQREEEAAAATASAAAAAAAKKPAKGAKPGEAPTPVPVAPPTAEEEEGAVRIKELKKAYREVRSGAKTEPPPTITSFAARGAALIRLHLSSRSRRRLTWHSPTPPLDARRRSSTTSSPCGARRTTRRAWWSRR